MQLNGAEKPVCKENASEMHDLKSRYFLYKKQDRSSEIIKANDSLAAVHGLEEPHPQTWELARHVNSWGLPQV